MRKKFILWEMVIIIGVLVIAGKDAKAVMNLTDDLSLTGFTRYEIGIHTAESNPNLPENHKLTLSKFFLQTEWYYQPSDKFEVFANIRLLGDTTSLWDDNLRNYNAFPVDVPKYDWMMMKASEDHFRAEIWELYADVTLGDLWLRLGRQSIGWGELVGARILDAVNSVDLSWNMSFEPEEFEIIRIPNWAIRGIYNLTNYAPSWIANPSIEAFLNPGDVTHDIMGDEYAPFFLTKFPPVLKINEKNNRGKLEYGVRCGGQFKSFYATLNYLHVYNDSFSLDFRGIEGGKLLIDQRYEELDLYGMSINYAFGYPANLVITLESLWSPNQPFADARSRTPAIRDQGQFKYAIKCDYATWLLPPTFLAANLTSFILQFSQTVVEGDENKIFGGGNSKIDKNVDIWALVITQPLLRNTVIAGFQIVYDTDGGYLIKPSLKYAPNERWYFDIWVNSLGGKEKRPGRLGGLYWTDSVYGRITYQF